MFKKLSHRQKLKLTSAVALLAMLLCYRLSISRTVEEYRKFAAHKNEKQYVMDAPSVENILANEERIDAYFRKYALDTLLPEKNLLAVASNYCKSNGLSLKEYKPYDLPSHDSIPVLTRIITVEGGFIPCLKLVNVLETGGKVGRVSSVDFASYTDPKDKTVRLTCTLYIQNLIASNHEDTQK